MSPGFPRIWQSGPSSSVSLTSGPEEEMAQRLATPTPHPSSGPILREEKGNKAAPIRYPGLLPVNWIPSFKTVFRSTSLPSPKRVTTAKALHTFSPYLFDGAV
jgi:hypothetical protein